MTGAGVEEGAGEGVTVVTETAIVATETAIVVTETAIVVTGVTEAGVGAGGGGLALIQGTVLRGETGKWAREDPFFCFVFSFRFVFFKVLRYSCVSVSVLALHVFFCLWLFWVFGCAFVVLCCLCVLTFS